MEAIVGIRVVATQVQYEIKWKGYGKKHNTWKPACELNDCAMLILEFSKLPLLKSNIKFYD